MCYTAAEGAHLTSKLGFQGAHTMREIPPHDGRVGSAHMHVKNL